MLSCLTRHIRKYVTIVIILMVLTRTPKFLTLTNSKIFARKVVRLGARVRQEDVDNEVRAIIKLCQTNHPNIVQVLDYGWLKADGVEYFIDMELCEISLENYI